MSLNNEKVKAEENSYKSFVDEHVKLISKIVNFVLTGFVFFVLSIYKTFM